MDMKPLKSPYFHGRTEDGDLMTIKDRRNGGTHYLCVACGKGKNVGQIAQCEADLFGSLRDTLDQLIPIVEQCVNGKMDKLVLKKKLGEIKAQREKDVAKEKAARQPRR
eukprot:3067413-Heterocapsa_arctica.AAC.1